MPPVMEKAHAPQVPMLKLKTLWFQVAGTICNLRCSHCFISCSPENDSHKMMMRTQVQGYLQEAVGLGVEEFYFTGGEPFLNRELPDILLDALAIGPATVLTNGMLITESMAKRLRAAQESSPHRLEFRVSLDGATAEENDRIRGRGVFELATRGIRNLRAAGFEPIITSCQTDEKKDPAAFRAGFEKLAKSLGQETPRLKILPPLYLGALEKTARGYTAGEKVTDACFVNYPWENLQCSTGRMVTSEGVYVCPILIDEPSARMGRTIAETVRPFPLAYSACYTCRMQGLTCGNETTSPVTREDVKTFYAQAAREPQPRLCCPDGAYAPEDTAHIPENVLERSYGCGSPMGSADIQPGETVVDLGAGAGIDVFVASKKVGPSGKATGIDMTAEMLNQARTAAGPVAQNLGYCNTEFRHGFLEQVPLDAETADLVTSNCVVNLSTDKKKVFQEVARILKHGGRFVISDIIAEKPVPGDLQKDKELWGECLVGALTESELLKAAESAGFYGLEILKRSFYKEAAGYHFWAVTVRGWKFKKGPVDEPAVKKVAAGTCYAPDGNGTACC